MLGALAAALLRSAAGATAGGALKRFAPICAGATGGGIDAWRWPRANSGGRAGPVDSEPAGVPAVFADCAAAAGDDA